MSKPVPFPPAVILAGGLGTRIRPIVSDLPKCMAPVNGRPFLEHLIRKLAGQEVRDIVLCVGYLRDQIQDHFQDGTRFEAKIRYAVEKELLGTAGAVGNARHLLEGDFFLLNGDTYVEVDLSHLYDAHLSRAGEEEYGGTIVTTMLPDRGNYGSISADPTGRILSFDEKRVCSVVRGSINSGVYCLTPAIFHFIPPDRPSSLEREVFPAALSGGLSLYAFPSSGVFVDIGTPEGYHRALDLLR